MFSGAIHKEHTERMVQTLPRKSYLSNGMDSHVFHQESPCLIEVKGVKKYRLGARDGH